MQNLRDKLLKAGLVTAEQKESAEKPKEPAPRRDARPPRERNEARPPEQSSRPDSRSERPRPEFRRPSGPPHSNGRPQQRVEPAEKRVPRLPPLALPGSKAFQRLESLKQVELDKKLRAMVHEAMVPVDVGATVFYFMTRKNRLRRLELTEAQAKLLENGTLAVVERPEPGSIEHSLVPREVAEKMISMSPKAVRFLNREGAPVGFMSDDELKQRQVDEANAAPEVPESETERAQQAEQEAELDAAEEELRAHEARKGQTPEA